MSGKWRHAGATFILCSPSALCLAHSFGTPYIPPLPLWMYVYGCVATLVLTFAVLCCLTTARERDERTNFQKYTAPPRLIKVSARWLDVLRGSSLLLFTLTIIAGLIGGQDPERNIATIAFWVIFLLLFAYVTALVGNVFPLINPWALIIAALERLGIDLSRKRVRYPSWMSYWPALGVYLTLVWIELFAPPLPRTVSVVLLGYTVASLLGVLLFGKSVWFEQVDFFGLYFRLFGKLAPIEHQLPDRSTWQVGLRKPLSGTLSDRPRNFSLVLFVLVMLASTTYDSIHGTALWTRLFWRNLLAILQPLWGTDIQKAQDLLMGWFLFYRQAGLVAFPILYLAIYLLFIFFTKALLKHGLISTIAFVFCYSLLPIAAAYHFTHYFPFLISLGGTLPNLLSDPFALGWSLLAVPASTAEPTLPMGFIWHTQVGVLLIGHLASINLAHKMTLVSTLNQAQRVTSQLPLLSLMIIYTVIGLWVLSLPLAAE